MCCHSDRGLLGYDAAVCRRVTADTAERVVLLGCAMPLRRAMLLALHTRVRACVHARLPVCMHARILVNMCACVQHVQECVHTSVCACICMHVHARAPVTHRHVHRCACMMGGWLLNLILDPRVHKWVERLFEVDELGSIDPRHNRAQFRLELVTRLSTTPTPAAMLCRIWSMAIWVGRVIVSVAAVLCNNASMPFAPSAPRECLWTYTRTRVCRRTHMYAQKTPAHAHARTCTHTQTHTHAHTRTHTHAHTQSQAHTHAHAHAQSHTCARTPHTHAGWGGGGRVWFVSQHVSCSRRRYRYREEVDAGGMTGSAQPHREDGQTSSLGHVSMGREQRAECSGWRR